MDMYLMLIRSMLTFTHRALNNNGGWPGGYRETGRETRGVTDLTPSAIVDGVKNVLKGRIQ